LYPTIAVAVESGERLGYLLHNDARAHEAVERDARLNPWVGTGLWYRCVFALQEIEQLRGKPVTKLVQSILELGTIDTAGSIAVEVVEDALPILYVLPQAGKLVETDLTAPISVEDVHEKFDSVEIKGGPISIYQRPLELGCRYLA